LRHVLAVISGATPESGEAEYWDGEIPWVTPEDVSGVKPGYRLRETRRSISRGGYESCGTTLAPKDSIVLTKRAPIGQLAVLDIDACSNQGCLLLTPKRATDSRFFYYLLLTQSPWLQILGRGSTFMELSVDDLKSFPLPVPDLAEQRAIADYLDRETARLDALVAAKQRLLELLAEKHRALITRAVTRGLNPDAPLRESGFSWLGPIPSHWGIIKLKHIAAISYGVGDELDKSLTSGVPLISLPNVSLDGTLDLTGLGWAALNESEKMQLLLNKGDLLFNWRNGSSEHLAKTAYFEADGEFTHVGFLLRIRFDLSRFESRFYQAFLNALRVRGFFLYSRAMVNNTFNQTELANLPVVVPPLLEQRAIVAHISAETAKLDALREAAERTTGLLKERRAALIAAAVTGKIKSIS
jgi:type I restriction enzyme S subunit